MARQDMTDPEATRIEENAKNGDTGQPEDIPLEPGGASVSSPAGGGPRIVINPTTFRNKKDALCVAFNEGFRLWMEANDFQPRSEPTDAQRKFFSDTAYADDELQLRRTILARIATFDTSVKDPTDDQLSETAAFLDAILDSDWCKNDWERDAVSRLSNAVKAAVGAEPVEPREPPLEPRTREPLQARAAMGGGETEDDEQRKPQEPDPQEPDPQEPDPQEPDPQEPDPRQAKGYVGAEDEDYDPSLDMNSDQYDSKKATSYMADKLVEIGKFTVESGIPDQPGDTEGPETESGSPAPAAEDGAATALADDGLAADKAKDVDRNGDGTEIDHKADEMEAKDQSDRDEIDADYARLKASGALDDNASFGNSGQISSEKQAKTPSGGQKDEDTTGVAAAQPAPGESVNPAKPYRSGAIENPIVDPNSPGSLSYKGPRKGGIESPIVDPEAEGSLDSSEVKPGEIENPVVDQDSPASLLSRRRKKRRR